MGTTRARSPPFSAPFTHEGGGGLTEHIATRVCRRYQEGGGTRWEESVEHPPPLTLQPAGGPSSGDRPSPTQVASVPTRRGWELRHPHPVTTLSPPCHHPPLPRCVLAPSHACSPLRRCPRCHPSLPSSRTLDPFADAVVGGAVCLRTRLFTLSLGSAFGQCRARANCGT